jgi:hypothetical protein
MFLLLFAFSRDDVLCSLGLCMFSLVFAVPIHDAPIETSPKHITSVLMLVPPYASVRHKLETNEPNIFVNRFTVFILLVLEIIR